jgi:hypothetical protein
MTNPVGVAAALVLATALSAGAGSVRTVFNVVKGWEDRTAFATMRNRNLDDYVMSSRSGQQQRLTRNPAEDVVSAWWSPDRKLIAFGKQAPWQPAGLVNDMLSLVAFCPLLPASTA